MVDVNDRQPGALALIVEAQEEFARVWAMLERRYAREGRPILRESDMDPLRIPDDVSGQSIGAAGPRRTSAG